MTNAVDLLKSPNPDYIKMDFDGIEHLILKGGICILKQAKSILIAINDKFAVHAADASKYLQEVRRTLKKKRYADCFD